MADPLTYALVDCANFYVSCERVFAPHLWSRPVAVLSNNDGCVIARSQEVKALGIPMGAPYFKHRRALAEAGVTVFSSNYTLYGDMSRRVHEVLHAFADDVEAYSIDEAFLCVRGLGAEEALALGRAVRARVRRWTGIPVRIGLGPTKTLAKAADVLAKRAGRGEAPVHYLAADDDAGLEAVPVGEVWGIGRQYQRLLEAEGILTARALRDQPDAWVRGRMRVTGLRTVHELRGIACLPLALAPPRRRTLVHSRMFGRPVTTCEELEEAVARYATRAAARLRRHRLVAHLLHVFVTTGPFARRPYSKAIATQLPSGTSYTPQIVHTARACARRAFRAGYDYTKAGVMLLDLAPEGGAQANLFERLDDEAARRSALMDTLDAVNRRYGREALVVASAGASRVETPLCTRDEPRDGRMRREWLSQHYTTRWDQLPVARADGAE